MENKKVSLLDWRFGWGLFFLIIMIVLLTVSLILFGSVSFNDKFSDYLGNGFWSLQHFGIHDLLFNWKTLDNNASIEPWQSHPFLQVNIAIIFLFFLVPFFLVIGLFLIIRWWLKTRI